MEETKEVGFEGLELKIAKPSLNQDKTVSVTGNFDSLKANIQKVVDRYKDTQLTDDNVAYVKNLKGQFVSLRTSIDRERKEWKKVYLDPADKLIDSMCKELQAVVAEGEMALTAQLNAYDQRRKDEITLVIKEDYIPEAVAKHNLREEYASQIQIKDKYYNKTQSEEDTIDDIELQACELERKQKEYDSGVVLIKTECEDAGFLPDSYIRDLKYKSAMEIILEIKADKKASQAIQEKIDAGERVTVGKIPDDTELVELQAKAESFDKKELRERILRVRYRPEQAKIMAKFFKENNISFEFINADF